MFQQKVSVLEEVVRTNSADPQVCSHGTLSLSLVTFLIYNFQPTVDTSVAEECTSTGGNPLVMRSCSQEDAHSRAELFRKVTGHSFVVMSGVICISAVHR